MATLAYTLTNTRFFLGLLVASLATAMGIIQVGPHPFLVVGVFFLFIPLLYHRPILVVLLWPIFLGFEIFSPQGVLRVSGFILLPMDPAYFFGLGYLLINVVIRPKEFLQILRENLFLSLFLAILVLYIILYTPSYGKSAIGEARKFYFLFFFPIIVAFATKKFNDLRTLLSYVLLLACLISSLAYIRLIGGRLMETLVHAEGSLILLLASFSVLILQINGVTIIKKKLTQYY